MPASGSSRTGRSGCTWNWAIRRGSCGCMSSRRRARHDRSDRRGVRARARVARRRRRHSFADAATPARIAALHDHDLDLFSRTTRPSARATGAVFHWRAGTDLRGRADQASRGRRAVRLRDESGGRWPLAVPLRPFPARALPCSALSKSRRRARNRRQIVEARGFDVACFLQLADRRRPRAVERELLRHRPMLLQRIVRGRRSPARDNTTSPDASARRASPAARAFALRQNGAR